MMTTTAHPTQQPVTRPFRTPVRGHAFAARVPGAADPTPGQFARLVREPANPADRYAVSVWVAGVTGKWRIGYLDRSVAARIAPRLDRGARIAARIDGWTPEPDGRWRRPLVMLLPGGEQPRGGASDGAQAHREAPPGSAGTGADPARGPSSPPTDNSTSSAVAAGAPNEVRAAGPGLWGRPPGVSRRVVHDGSIPSRR